uniref:THO complex subunit 1-like n=1 Tax=Rhizophora mucronata TaxID=61149 RepID=A0A2P2M6H6_RHIMU
MLLSNLVLLKISKSRNKRCSKNIENIKTNSDLKLYAVFLFLFLACNVLPNIGGKEKKKQ